MPRDYYEVLGVARNATPEDITKAYKKLARQHHPDRNPGDAGAESRFKEIQNAYDTLIDGPKRSSYDQYGPDGPNLGGASAGGAGPGGFRFHFGGPGGGTPVNQDAANDLFRNLFSQGGQGVDLGEIFGSTVGGGGGGTGGIPRPRSGGRSRGRKAAPPETVEVETSIPFVTAAQGGSIDLAVEDREINVKVPAGFEDGKKLRVAGQGPGGADITVKIHVEPHAYFRREGKTLLIDVPISVGEAILGGKVEVPTLDGRRVEVKVKPGTSTGNRLRLPGFGIAGGDQYLIFKVVVPKGEPDTRSRQLIEEFMKLHPGDPRADAPWR